MNQNSNSIEKKRVGERLSAWRAAAMGFLRAKDKNGNNRLQGSVRFHAGLALFLEFVIECLCRHSFLKGGLFFLTSFYVFALNALIIFLTLLPVFYLKRKIFYDTLISFIWLGLGITDCIITCLRVTPFSMVDILNIPGVFPIIRIYLNPFQMILIGIAILCAIAALVVLAIKAPKCGRNLKKASITAIAALLIFAATLPLGLAMNLISRKFTNLNNAYADYGFPYCFSVSIFDRGVAKPKDYGEIEMQSIRKSIEESGTTENEHRPNVIFVQLESFFDVGTLSNVRFTENPTPYFTQLCRETISGSLQVPVIGAGTVNTEFEILTGMNLDYFGGGEYPYKTSLMNSTCESIPYNLMELGYSTHAIHNYQGTFYQRYKVYRNLGFQTFTSLEYMQNVEYNISGTWPKDNILTGQILDALNSTEGSDFIMTVSVQGHGKYPPNDLPDDYVPQIGAEFIDGTVEGGLSDINALIYYVGQLREMDDFVKELVSAIRQYPEDTVILFYGDHLPSLAFDDSDLTGGSVYSTPYVIVSNFGLEDSDVNLGNPEAYQIGAMLLDLLGIHNGYITRLHQNFADSENYQLWLSELEYDMLGGSSKHYLYDGKADYYPTIAEMQMGVKPITIDRWEYEDGTVTVYGQNFTGWSKIVIDGKVLDDTVLLDGNTLQAEILPEGMQTLSVAQVADNGTRLSETDEVVFYELSGEE